MSRHTGQDAGLGLAAATAHFKSVECTISKSKFEANSSDTKTVQRGSGVLDAKLVYKGWDTVANTGLSFAEVAAMVTADTAPSALTWTDKATMPATRFPADFFTLWPLDTWRVDEAAGGTGGPDDPAEWTVTLTPGNF